MTTNNGFLNYYIDDFYMTVSPGRNARCVIYFKSAGRLINIRGYELFDRDTHRHLGWVYSQNVTLTVQREATNYIRNHVKKWIRVHSGVVPA